MFTVCLKEGIIPDFLIVHTYPTLLDSINPENDAKCLADVTNIQKFTDNLNAIVAKYFDSNYVGKIEYALMEWSACPGDRFSWNSCTLLPNLSARRRPRLKR